MSALHHSTEKHPLSSGMDHALDSETQGPVKQLRRPGDNGPAMQSAANASAQVKQLKASEAAANTAVIQHKQSNETGLPGQLKSGIESLSGMSMDHVKVVYNSSKPAEVNALAYAQGSVIHVAPGQEQHLPEEAWHVVQQMQGKVKATTEVDDKAVNDDEGLEREASTMGAKAAGLNAESLNSEGSAPKAPPAHADTPIQRRVYVPFEDQYKENWDSMKNNEQEELTNANKVAKELDTIVDEKREEALHWEGLQDGGDKHLVNWKKIAKAYYEKPEKVPKILYARFGYAVEVLACKKVQGKTMHGFSVHLQEAHGHTRPDIILKRVSKKDDDGYAWIDITAEKSAGHIFQKSSSGWKKKPYVAEVIYPSLSPDEVLKSENDPMMNDLANLNGRKFKMQSEQFGKQRKGLKDDLVKNRNEKNVYSDRVTTPKSPLRLTETKRFLEKDLGVDLGGNCNQKAKGAISFAGLLHSEFGTQKGKTDARAAMNYTYEKARPPIMMELLKMNHLQITNSLEFLNRWHDHPVIETFNKAKNSLSEQVFKAYHFLAQLGKGKMLPKEQTGLLMQILDFHTQLAEKGITIEHTFKVLSENKQSELINLFAFGGSFERYNEDDTKKQDAMSRINKMQFTDSGANWRKCYKDVREIFGLENREEMQTNQLLTSMIMGDLLQNFLQEEGEDLLDDDFNETKEALKVNRDEDELDDKIIQDELEDDETSIEGFEGLQEDFERFTDEEAFLFSLAGYEEEESEEDNLEIEELDEDIFEFI